MPSISIRQNIESVDRLVEMSLLSITNKSFSIVHIDLFVIFSCYLSETKCSHLLGPSKHCRSQRFPKSYINYEAGFDQRPESTHNSDSDDQSEPLLQNRYVMKDVGDFKKKQQWRH